MQKMVAPVTAFLYKNFLKKLLFEFDPEEVHRFMVKMGVTLGAIPPVRTVISWCWSYHHKKLVKKIDGITFPNPVGLSAGFDYEADLLEAAPMIGFGFHTIGTITHHAYEGNKRPRLARFPNSKALLVNKGLKNLGAKATIEKLKQQKMHIPTGISIASTNTSFANEKEQIQDILSCFKLFEKSSLRHAFYELNISCPNTFGGEPFTTPEKLERLVSALDTLKVVRPIYVKMPIDLSLKETKQLLRTLVPHNIQGVIFGNLTKDKQNPDVQAQDQKKWHLMKGNLSGKPTWQRSNERIALTKSTFGNRFTIIGTGGIFSGEDAVQKMELGADLVQLITGMIYEGPQLIGQICSRLSKETTS